MKVSILTAVYNTASYLPQCIESVLAQTHRDWQLICIDDCSTDGSLDIINRYAASDSRITVVRNAENQGQAKARNAGLLHADGEIVTMLDSDDWIAPDALEKIVAAFEGNREIDCVLFDLQLYYSPDDVRPYHNAVSHTVTGYEAFRLSIAWQIHGVYAARRQVYDKHRYDDSCRSHSDDNTTRFHYLDSRKVAFSTARYYYRQHAASCTHVFGMQRFNLLVALENLRRELEADGRVAACDLRELDKYRWHNVQGAYMLYYARRRQFPPSDRRKAKLLLRQMYSSVDTTALPLWEHFRFGYAPIKWCPALYRLQMNAFTHLRLLFGLDKKRYD